MKIGIFGDSFADAPNNLLSLGWPSLIESKLGSVGFHARSGTSVWTAYEKFKEHHDKYDIIILSLTSYLRWPHLPYEFQGQNHNVDYRGGNDLLSEINPFFFEIYSDELLMFISRMVHKEIVEECKRSKKYLITLLPFYEKNDVNKHPALYKSLFPAITGLSEISHREVIDVGTGIENTAGQLAKHKLMDYRPCHLNGANNKIIADWIIDCINNKKYNETFAGEEYNGWVLNDESEKELFMKYMKVNTK